MLRGCHILLQTLTLTLWDRYNHYLDFTKRKPKQKEVKNEFQINSEKCLAWEIQTGRQTGRQTDKQLQYQGLLTQR